MHHGWKKDAPSGTAMELARQAASAREWDDDTIFTSRPDGERPHERIGVQALRGGDIKGEHTVFFIGDTERVELTHRAYGRKVFAQGAVRAAAWLMDRAPGIYSMTDVLGLPPCMTWWRAVTVFQSSLAVHDSKKGPLWSHGGMGAGFQL